MIFLTLFIQSSLCLAVGSSENLSGNSLIIRKTLQELNETIFFPRSIRVELVKDCPEVIPVLAQWGYETWRSYNTSLTPEILVDVFNKRLNDDKLPLSLVLFRDKEPIGVISLDDHSEPELADLEDGNPWGDSFHVVPSERNKGLGMDLAQAAVTVAKQLGYQAIHFYTSIPLNVGWYVERGAKVIGKRPYHNHWITIMTFPLPSE